MREFDYVVVGAGSAGCVLAAELSADADVRVLVLECGQRAEENPETLLAAGYGEAFTNEGLMFDRYSTPQQGCADHRLFVGTGRGVGGSGGINAMVYTRGAKFDFDSWGVDGWRWDDLAPDFASLEARLDVHRRPPTEWTEACIAGAEQVGFRRKEDFNDGDLCGHLGYEWMNYQGDARRSSYVSFLRPALAARTNLTLETGCTVRRIVVEDGRAVGVELEQAGRTEFVRAGREVVLCAGALESPKLLMLSGIGPAAELARHGIAMVADRPAVGTNLMDHPNVQVFFRGKRPIDCKFVQLYGFHRAHPASHLPEGEADTCYVFYSARSSFREGAMRLVPGMTLPPVLYRIDWLRRGLRRLLGAIFSFWPVRRFVERMWGIVVILGKPRSRGRLLLASTDARDHAAIDLNFFDDPADLEALVRGVELARKVAATPALAAWGNRELMPGRRVDTDGKLADFIRKNVITTYHFSGTCRIGNDPDSVVDPALRVRGVDRLRIADASIVPTVPVSAMNAPSMVIGLRAARLLRESRGA